MMCRSSHLAPNRSHQPLSGFDYQWTYNGRASVPFPLQGVWNGAGRSASSAVRRSGARGPDLLGQKALTDHHHRVAGT